MNCLWEVMLKAKQQGIPEDKIKFQIAHDFSAYMEVSCPYLNQDTLDDLPAIEVNPYYRFYSIFKDLYCPEMTEYPQSRKSLTNLIFHQLAENDVISGMTKETYYKKLLFEDFINNLYGSAAMAAMELFNRDEREIILSGILRQYETGSSLDIFKDMMEELIPKNIVYRNNDNFHEIMVFIGQKSSKTIASKLELLIQMFVEIPYTVDIYYEYHFGIIGFDETLEIDEIAIC